MGPPTLLHAVFGSHFLTDNLPNSKTITGNRTLTYSIGSYRNRCEILFYSLERRSMTVCFEAITPNFRPLRNSNASI